VWRDQCRRVTAIQENDIPHLVKQLEHHFTHYKDLKKPGSTHVLGWGDVEEAKTIVKQCIVRYTEQ
jgi:inorganic pyrophosphatase